MSVTGSQAYVATYDYDANNRLTQESKVSGTTTERTNYHYDRYGTTEKVEKHRIKTLRHCPALLCPHPITFADSSIFHSGQRGQPGTERFCHKKLTIRTVLNCHNCQNGAGTRDVSPASRKRVTHSDGYGFADNRPVGAAAGFATDGGDPADRQAAA